MSLAVTFGVMTAGAQITPRQTLSSSEKTIPAEGRITHVIGSVPKNDVIPMSRVIDKQPEGTLIECERSSGVYSPEFLGVTYGHVVGQVGKFVVADDAIYIYNPVGYPTETWVKAEKQSDGTYLVKGDQVVYTETDTSTGAVYEFALVNLVDGGDDWFYMDERNQEIVYTYKDGVLELVEREKTIVGLIYNDTAEWAGVGVDSDRMVPVTDTPNVVPDNLSYEEYLFTHSDGSFLASVAFQDNKVYVGIPDLPEQYNFVGTISGDKVVFEDKQLICCDESMGYYFYLCNLDATKGYDEEVDRYFYEFTMNDKDIEFDYDAATKTLTTDDNFAINAGKTQVSFMACYMTCKLEPWVELPGTPVAPEIISVMPYDEGWGSGTLDFYIYCKDINGRYLDSDKMYYKFYIDGEEYERDPSEYYGDGEPMVEIPLDYWDMNLYGGSEWVTFYFDFTGFESLGIQSIYKGGGETHYSEITYYYPSGVEDVAADNEVVSEIYTDLMGRKVVNPESGMYIRTVVYGDGTCESTKFVKP